LFLINIWLLKWASPFNHF